MSRRKDQKVPQAENSLQSLLERASITRFCGAVWSPSEPERRFVVEFLLDGISVELAVAGDFEPSLTRAGDGCHGFSFQIDAEILAEASVAEVRLANLGLPVGLPIFLHDGDKFECPAVGVPPVQWLGGLRFMGAVLPNENASGQMPVVKAVIDGEIVAEAIPSRWKNNGLLGKEAMALAAFDLYLPRHFAEGCVHRVHFIGAGGLPLPGSPLVFAAFADGLAALVAERAAIESERLRGEMFDWLMPMSVPLSHYEHWRERLPKRAQPADESVSYVAGVTLVGDGDVDASLASLESQTHENWVALTLPYTDRAQGFDCNALRDFLAQDAASCGFIVFATAGFHLTPDAIERFSEAFAAHPRAFIAYGDIAIRDSQGHAWPIAFSAFDYERLLEQGYCCSLFAVKREALTSSLQDKTLNLYRLFNSIVSDPVQDGALHLPVCFGTIADLNTISAGRALVSATTAHLRSRGIKAKVTLAHSHLFPAVRVTRQPANPSVSIIIPVRNRVDLLRKCLESIDPAVKKNAAEIIIIDNDSSDPETLAFLAGFEAPKRRVLRVAGAFNFSKLNNLAAQAVASDYLCLLNNDVRALDSLWLDELLSRCAEEDVAAVGALLIWPSGVVQHGGVVLGPNFGATHAFNDRLESDPGYADLLLVARECSAITAARLLTRRADYLAVGGLDEVFFPINFNDVDYCLKQRARGKRIIFTPHARLLHLESASRGDHQSAHRKGLFERELRSLRTRWMEALLADPSYSPLLSLDPVPYSALAWPLRTLLPRWRSLPLQADIPAGM